MRDKTRRLGSYFSATALREAAVAGTTLAVLVAFAFRLRSEGHLDDWLAWILLKVWGWQLLLALSMASAGQAILLRALGIRRLPPLSLLSLAVPVGAVIFATGIFVAGYLGILTPGLAVVWPVVLIGTSAWFLRNDPEGLFLASWRRSRPRPSPSPLELVLITLGGLAVGLLYLQILSPDWITYDASWTHLVIAQDYAREGRIVPFYADWPKNLAHLGSVINTWSFLVPGLEPQALKTMMALHTEFVFFLWTLAAVAAGIARLGAKARGSWTAVFLFPAFYFDDHCLGGGADHFLAFFAVPIFFGALEAARTLQARWWAFLAIVAGGAVMTKYQAVIMIAPAAVLLAAAMTVDVVRRYRRGQAISGRRLWLGPAVALGLSLVVTAPHFLRNVIWYHNPIYPLGQRIFTGSFPTMPDAQVFAEHIQKNWGAHPASKLIPWLRTLGRAIVTFPWHDKTPESGPMFALAALLALLLPGARRALLAIAFCVACLVTWNSTYVQTRNLQGVLPLFAAATGAVLIQAFRSKGPARFAVAALVGLQILASVDSGFADHDRIDRGLAMIRASREGRGRSWIGSYQRHYVEISNSLPKRAVVLLHSEHPSLGIDRPTLHDWLGFQGLIDHRRFRNARDLYLRYRELGVTHVLYQPNSHPADTRQDDAIFAVFAMRCRDTFHDFGPFRVFPMPAEPPQVEPTYRVLTAGIPDQDDGLYPVTDLGVSEDLPHALQSRKSPAVALEAKTEAQQIARTNVLLLRDDVLDNQRDLIGHEFDQFGRYRDFSVYVRR